MVTTMVINIATAMVTPIIMAMVMAMVEIQTQKVKNYFKYKKTTLIGWFFYTIFKKIG